MKYLFDLDGTLIHSDVLNNDAYNYALEKFGYPQIISPERRLTKEGFTICQNRGFNKYHQTKTKVFYRNLVAISAHNKYCIDSTDKKNWQR